MSKKNDHIDDLFKDALGGLEEAPRENLWNEISGDISGPKVDDIFRSALDNDSAQPSDKVWAGVEDNLPLNLGLKRRLASLSYVAAAVVVGMVFITVFFNNTSSIDNENSIAQPILEEEKPYHIDIAIEEVSNIEEDGEIKKSPGIENDEPIALDNVIEENIQEVELHEETEIVLNVDEEKIRKILEPILPLPIDSAVARVNADKNTTTETEYSVVPEIEEEEEDNP